MIKNVNPSSFVNRNTVLMQGDGINLYIWIFWYFVNTNPFLSVVHSFTELWCDIGTLLCSFWQFCSSNWRTLKIFSIQDFYSKSLQSWRAVSICVTSRNQSTRFFQWIKCNNTKCLGNMVVSTLKAVLVLKALFLYTSLRGRTWMEEHARDLHRSPCYVRSYAFFTNSFTYHVYTDLLAQIVRKF